MDKNLLLRLGQGDKRAFSVIFHLYHEKVFGLAFKSMKNRDNAKDLTQDVFAKVWRNRVVFSEAEKFENLLMMATKRMIITYQVHDHARHVWNHRFKAARVVIDYDTETAKSDWFLKLGFLSDTQLEVFRFWRLQELSKDFIATRLGITANTVKYHMKQINRILRLADTML